ncbi:unnamed protein product [Pararhodospirillum photometricum DSM 122]|uniref:Uncharacterized protein n=1 Tax=Pararhodospirillum photometricum DSM 122 TaxID=1150469 RepID=H6SM01_PARPM|nr:unnamed protein product [Pararhodospirillum photometricum DSM 122]
MFPYLICATVSVKTQGKTYPPSRLLKKSFTASFQNDLIVIVEEKLNSEYAVVVEFGRF